MKPTQFKRFLFFSHRFFFLSNAFTNFRRFIATRQNVGSLSSFIFLSLALALNMLYSRCVVETIFLLIIFARCTSVSDLVVRPHFS